MNKINNFPLYLLTFICFFGFLFMIAPNSQGGGTLQKVQNVEVKKLSNENDKIRIRVNWGNVSGVEEYQVQLLKKCKTCKKNYKKIRTYSTDENFKIIKGKKAGYIKNKRYAVRVRTLDGKWSKKKWFTPRPFPLKCKSKPSVPNTSNPDIVVGNGTKASCTEQAFKNAVAQGGIVKFNCGKKPHIIKLTSEANINSSKDTIIDGENNITLSGGKTTRILKMDTENFESLSPTLTVVNLTFKNAQSSGHARYNENGDYLGTGADGGGGAIYFYGGNVKSFNNAFINNNCPDWGPDLAGGGIYGVGRGIMTVVNSTFDGNGCSNGGAVGGVCMLP